MSTHVDVRGKVFSHKHWLNLIVLSRNVVHVQLASSHWLPPCYVAIFKQECWYNMANPGNMCDNVSVDLKRKTHLHAFWIHLNLNFPSLFWQTVFIKFRSMWTINKSPLRHPQRHYFRPAALSLIKWQSCFWQNYCQKQRFNKQGGKSAHCYITAKCR